MPIRDRWQYITCLECLSIQERNKTVTRLLITILILHTFDNAKAESTFIEDSGNVSHYSIHQSVGNIKIDGHLDEYAWERAEQINDFNRILNHYDKIQSPTRAKMLWDQKFLYVGFHCDDREMWAVYENEDDQLWEEEVVEIFIDPDGDGKNYLELEVSPTNTVVDLLIKSVEPEFQSDKDWDIVGLKTAVQLHGTVNDISDDDLGWSVEIAIPWTAFVAMDLDGSPPKQGDSWRLNLYRIERSAGHAARKELLNMKDQSMAVGKEIERIWSDNNTDPGNHSALPSKARIRLADLEQRSVIFNEATKNYGDLTEYTAWSETYKRGFHHPQRFGVVHFIEIP